ncbi:hypothetical protein B0H14DRAFT_3464205 [Mycena olivaceomarginata]|nr:hypothetical protein B0H14DRAFT_3464205 [Mycena olivaceomarginata]
MAIFAPRLHVSLNVPEQFGKQTANITQALTLTLLFRPGGAVIFVSGPSSSTSGSSRSSSSVPNRPVGLHGLASGVLQQGYAVGYLVGPPALFAFVGISGMGGDFGELGIAAVISLDLVLTVHVGWHSLFWTAAGIGVFGACLCALLPESKVLVKVWLAFLGLLSAYALPDRRCPLSYCPLLHPTPHYPPSPPPPLPCLWWKNTR